MKNAKLVIASSLLAIALNTPAFAHGTAYVTNENGGVSVIDMHTFQIVKEIDVGGTGPRGLALTDDGKFLLTANRKTDDVSVIDTATGMVTQRLHVGKGPEFVRIKGDRAYVTFEPEATGGPPEGKPGDAKPAEQAAAKSEEPKAGAKGKGDDDDAKLAHIAIIDVKTWKVVASLVSGLETEGVGFSTDGKNLVVTNEGDETISVYDRMNGKHIKTISTRALGKRPRGIQVMPDGKGYLATLEGSSTLLVLDNDFNVVKSIETKTGPYGIAYSPDGKQVLVAAARASTLQVFDAATLQQVAEAPIGMRCWHFAYTPDKEKILVACGRSNDIRVLDAHDFHEVAKVEGAKLPWGVVTFPENLGQLGIGK